MPSTSDAVADPSARRRRGGVELVGVVFSRAEGSTEPPGPLP
ncbi:MAG: hypothetical protein U0871_10655 [Gemmataceae bacterium]